MNNENFLNATTAFTDVICSWNFVTDIVAEEIDKEKPLAEEQEGLLEENFEKKNYRSWFVNALLLEVKQSLYKSKVVLENESGYEIVDQYLAIQDSENQKVFRLELSRNAAFALCDFYEQDLVLLSPHVDKESEAAEHLLALVEKSKDRLLSLRVVINEDSLRFRKMASHIASFTSIKAASWKLKKITSLITFVREYKAIVAVTHQPYENKFSRNSCSSKIKEEVISTFEDSKAVPSASIFSLKISEKLDAILKARHNASQYEAIQSCLKFSEGITCIRGPPGTGKTSTILGIISALLSCEHETVSIPSSTNFKKTKFNDERLFADFDELEYGIEDLDEDFSNTNDSCSRKISEGSLSSTAASSVFTLEDPDTEKRSLLVCAPSNAAIDEIVRRLTSVYLYDKEGKAFKPKVLRLGPNVHPDLRGASLEYKLDAGAAAAAAAAGSGAAEALRRETLRQRLLESADIICSTLSVAGSRELLNSGLRFASVVVDEASQAIEPSTLIPTSLGCQRLVLVGDERQLQPTLFSSVAQSRYNFCVSLFERLLNCGHSAVMLSEQFRMHPTIAAFPSAVFYEGALTNSPNFKVGVPFSDFYEVPLFKPLTFINVQAAAELKHQSHINETEAEIVMQLIDILQHIFKAADLKGKLGIIAPYKEQVKLLKKKLLILFGGEDPLAIDVNTVDGFQGREKDFIIFSAVRSLTVENDPNEKRSIGFLNDRRRLNVALTRARLNLWVIGNAEWLSVKPMWQQLWQYCNKQDAVLNLHLKKWETEFYLKRYLEELFIREPKFKIAFEKNCPQFLNHYI